MTTVVDFDEFHTVTLPERIAAGNGRLAAADVASVGAIGLRLTESGRGYTYLPTDGDVAIVEGVESARTVVDIDQASWNGLATDAETAPGLLYANRVTCTSGSPLRFVRWEPALRALYHGRPIYDPATWAPPVLGSGEPLDVTATFRIDDDPATMASHLDVTGYLHIRGVFDAEEVGAFAAATEALREAARPGDGRSWWARNSDGGEVLSRVTQAAGEPALGGLYRDPRIGTLMGLSRFDLTPKAGHSPEGVQVLWKLPEVAEGLSDLPWHRDCGLGGHATMCPLLIATVCVTGGGPGAGELRMLPGSWQASYPFIDADDPAAPQGIALAVEPGDVTLHYSDTMHASCAPYGPGPYRTSLLLAFVPDVATHAMGKQGYTAPLMTSPDGQVQHLADVLAEQPREA